MGIASLIRAAIKLEKNSCNFKRTGHVALAELNFFSVFTNKLQTKSIQSQAMALLSYVCSSWSTCGASFSKLPRPIGSNVVVNVGAFDPTAKSTITSALSLH